MGRFDMRTVTLGKLLDDPDALAVINQIVPGAASHPVAKLVRGMKAVDALQAAAGRMSDEERRVLIKRLEAL